MRAMHTSLIVLGLMVLADPVSPQDTAVGSSLSSDQIQEAIDWGTGKINPKHRPEPYPIGGFMSGGLLGIGMERVHQRGFVLTPYL